MGTHDVSVIIPTYNRRALVLETVASALPLFEHVTGEIVVVDDASRDGSDEALRQTFRRHVETQALRIVTNATNLGVTGAKNAGARQATGDWLVFLDSDDLLRPECIAPLVEQLRAAGDAPIVFFRCVDTRGTLIGERADRVRSLSTRDLVADWRWGECLPVVRRSAALQFPYDVDLKGVEGLTHYRITRSLGPALLSPLAARTYRDDGEDRLCAKAGLTARACELARGHRRMMREFWREMGPAGLAREVVVVGYHTLKCWNGRMRGRRAAAPSLAPSPGDRA